MKFKRNLIVAYGLIALTTLTGTVARSAEKKDIVDSAVAAGSFKTLATALQSADLVNALKGDGPFTVFAPTDDAFAKLPKGTVESLLKPENKKQLRSILMYHVVTGSVKAQDVIKLSHAKTLNGQRVNFKTTDGMVTIDNAQVQQTDIVCSNGVIHVIDKVILPSSDNIPTTVSKAGQFKTLLAAAKSSGLVDTLSGDGPMTVFAPTDKAFDKLPKGTLESLLKPENKNQLVGILKYHVVSGRIFSDAAVKTKRAKTLQGGEIHIKVRQDGAYVNNARLVKTDIDASNGVIHVIDHVLLPSKPKVTATDAQQMIKHAIARGARLYNSGHHQACAELYEQTMEKIVKDGDQFPSLAMKRMKTTLSQAEHAHCARSRALTLHHGLDETYRMLTSR